MKERILFFSNLFPNSQEINRGVFLYQLYLGLSAYYSIDVVAPLPYIPVVVKKLLRLKSVPKQDVVRGIPVNYPKYLVIPKVGRALHGFFMFLSIYPLLKRMTEQKKYTLINVQWAYPDGFAAVLSGKLLKLPVVVDCLGCDINEYTKYFLRRNLIVWTLKNATRVIVKSHEMKEKLVVLGIGGDTIEVIYNAIDEKLFYVRDKASCRKQLNIETDRPILAYIGNFQEEKGVAFLLKALPSVIQKNPAVKLLLIGDGPLRNELEGFVNKASLGEHVSFEGRKNHDDIPLYISASDIICLPSLREGCPNIMLEALACGVQVVGSAVGAVPDFINDDSRGALAQPKNPRSLADGINRCLAIENKKDLDFSWYGWDEMASITRTAFRTAHRKDELKITKN